MFYNDTKKIEYIDCQSVSNRVCKIGDTIHTIWRENFENKGWDMKCARDSLIAIEFEMLETNRLQKHYIYIYYRVGILGA